MTAVASPPSARFQLRDATAGAHERLDSLFAAFDLADRRAYGDFLRAQAGALLPVEAALDRAGAARAVDDWSARRRTDALLADLAALHLAPPPPVTAPEFGTDAALLGGLYVLEGSRLGGALLIRSVPSDLPRAFLTPGNPAAWRAFVELMGERLRLSADMEAAIEGAISVFAAFETSARNICGADRT